MAPNSALSPLGEGKLGWPRTPTAYLGVPVCLKLARYRRRSELVDGLVRVAANRALIKIEEKKGRNRWGSPSEGGTTEPDSSYHSGRVGTSD